MDSFTPAGNRIVFDRSKPVIVSKIRVAAEHPPVSLPSSDCMVKGSGQSL